MTSKAGLKAGLIGAAVMVVLTLGSLIPIPFLGCVCCGIIWLAYALIGALAGYYLSPPRTAGSGAGAGAIAGLVSGGVSGLVSAIIAAIQVAVGGTGQFTQFLDPETLRQLRDLGVDPGTFAPLAGVGGALLGGGFCCLVSLAAGAALGAIGGAVYSSIKPE